MKESNMIYILIVLFILGALFFLPGCFSNSNPERLNAENVIGGKAKKSSLPQDFTVKHDTVWYKEMPLPNVDVATFEVIDDYFAKDKNYVYEYGSYRASEDYYFTSKQYFSVIKEALPASFISLDYGYAMDQNTAWYLGKPFKVSDLNSIIILNEHFVKDYSSVYLDRIPLYGSDGRSFELIDNNYAKDINHVYYYLPDADGIYQATNLFCDTKSFKVIDGQYALDKDNVYFRGHKIPETDAASFSVLGNGFAKDNKSAYFETLKVKEADVFTFSVFKENELLNSGPYFAKDKQSVFANQQCFKNVDVFTFNVLNEKYSSDKNGVYYQLKKVKGAIPGSLKVYPHQMGDADAESNGIKYFEGKKVE